MTNKPRTRTYIVTAAKKVYAEVAVELPEEGFSAEFAINTAMNDLHQMSGEDAYNEGAVGFEGDWVFEGVCLARSDNAADTIIA